MKEATSRAVDKNSLKQLRKIEFVEYGVYRIELMATNRGGLSTICRVASVDMDGTATQTINFDSEEFGKQVMMGCILSMPICQAISAFHKACSASSD